MYEDSTRVGDSGGDATSTTVGILSADLSVAPLEEAHGRPVAEETCSHTTPTAHWYIVGTGDSTDLRSKDTTSATAVTRAPEVMLQQQNGDGATLDGATTSEATMVEGNTAVVAVTGSFPPTDVQSSRREGAIKNISTPSATDIKTLASSSMGQPSTAEYCVIPRGGTKIGEVCSAVFPDTLLGDTRGATTISPTEEESTAVEGVAGEACCKDKALLDALLSCPVPGVQGTLFISEMGTKIGSTPRSLRPVHDVEETLPAATTQLQEETCTMLPFDPSSSSEATLEVFSNTVDVEATPTESSVSLWAILREASTDYPVYHRSCPPAAEAPSMVGIGGEGEALPVGDKPLYPVTADASKEDSVLFVRGGESTTVTSGRS